jgi:hypothetical protein
MIVIGMSRSLSALFDDRDRNVAQLVGIVRELVRLQEAVVDHVIVFQQGEIIRVPSLENRGDLLVADLETGKLDFVPGPGDGRPTPRRRVLAVQQAKQPLGHRAGFPGRQNGHQLRVLLGKKVGDAAAVPVLQLLLRTGPQAAQHHRRHVLRICFGVGQAERGAPRPAEEDDSGQPELPAECLDVGHEELRRVLAQFRVGQTPPGPALIVQHDQVFRRIEVATHPLRTAAAGSAVQHEDRQAGPGAA